MTQARGGDARPLALAVADAVADMWGRACVQPPDDQGRVVVVGLTEDVERERFTVHPTGLVTEGRG